MVIHSKVIVYMLYLYQIELNSKISDNITSWLNINALVCGLDKQAISGFCFCNIKGKVKGKICIHILRFFILFCISANTITNCSVGY